MLTEPTLDKLKALRLDAFAAAWRAQQQDPALAAVPFDERLGLLVEAEWLARENRRLATALREAKLRLSQACVEDIDHAARRELDKALLRQLATCRWVHDHHNVLISGKGFRGQSRERSTEREQMFGLPPKGQLFAVLRNLGKSL